MIGSILGIIASGLRLAADWFGKYSSKENEAARELTKDNRELDQLHKDLKNRDIDAVRRDMH
jgi:hypothetical protein